MTNQLQLPGFDLECMGTAEMQILHMAARPRQAVDSGAITAAGMEEQLLLCAMRKKLGDGTTSVL